MRNIYDSRQYLKYIFIIGATLISVVSVVISDSLIKKLAAEERQRIEIWAATTRIWTLEDSEENPNYVRDQTNLLLFDIIHGNTTIPIIVCDDHDHIVDNRNIQVSEKEGDAYLKKKIGEFKAKNPPIVMEIDEGIHHYVYYDDSIILKRLLVFPYAQLLVMFIFIVIAFLALMSTKRAEQNKVWVGLSKETAHQLGTPISSLIAWIEYLNTKEVDAVYLTEMEKDVKRLETIADRFSKIGSSPDLKPLNINEAIRTSCEYMGSRISSKVKVTVDAPERRLFVLMSESLFSWVIENLTKNAVDAMGGQGSLRFQVRERGQKVCIDVSDTGKGLPKAKFKTIFNPGYTTKTRGWGLGLSLVKRIVESCPGGKIYVRESLLGKGTTFRIELRKQK
ncbi:MAG: HAMP domain-containing histidine kinase [Tannerella sp.]|jgi:two-component sensor histidine kinase|nr:HAMP domain-containing histidine kinase [Tannerella sp.]